MQQTYHHVRCVLPARSRAFIGSHSVASGYKIMSYPVRLPHAKYERHALSFAMGMVFSQDAETHPYEMVLCKLGSFMEQLEVSEHLRFEVLPTSRRRAAVGDGVSFPSSVQSKIGVHGAQNLHETQ